MSPAIEQDPKTVFDLKERLEKLADQPQARGSRRATEKVALEVTDKSGRFDDEDVRRWLRRLRELERRSHFYEIRTRRPERKIILDAVGDLGVQYQVLMERAAIAVPGVDTPGSKPTSPSRTPGKTKKKVLRRHPRIDAAMPGDGGIEVVVFISPDPDPETSGSFEVTTTANESVPVSVLLVLGDGVVITEGANPQPITVPAQELEDSTKAEWRLELAAGKKLEDVDIVAQFHARGLPCGLAVRPLGPRKTTVAADEGDGVSVHPDAESPDMTVIVEQITQGKAEYRVTVTAPHRETLVQDSWSLDADVDDWVRSWTDAISNGDDANVAEDLISVGATLFEASPRAFQDMYWRLARDGHPPRSLLVQSAEAFMPWELLVPCEPDTDAEELVALGTSCAIGRWPLPGPAVIEEMAIDGAIVVDPGDLDAAADETKAIARLIKPTQTIHPRSRKALYEHFKANDHSLIHFICHGQIDGSKRFTLSIGDDDVPVDTIRISVLRNSVRRSKPMVFLNACEVGGATSIAGLVSGFGPAFAGMGARAVIAPLWPASDDIACQVAIDFYTALRAGGAVRPAQVLQELRKKSYVDGGDDTWAAYTYYGNPLAAVAPDQAAAKKAVATKKAAATKKAKRRLGTRRRGR